MQSKEQQLKGARDRLLAAIRLIDEGTGFEDVSAMLRSIVVEIESELREAARRS